MLTRILRAGISDSLSVHQSKRVLLINKYCLSIACITLPYVFIFLFAGAPMLGLLVIPVVLGYCAAILVNHFRWHNTACAVMLITGNAAVTTFSLVCGRDCGISLYFFALMVFPFITFDFNDAKKILAGISLPLSLFIGVEIISHRLGAWVHISDDVQLIIYLSMIFSSALSILLVALYNFTQMSKTISELKETNNSLEVIFDNAYDIIMTIERGSIYTRINKGGMGTHDVKAIPGKSIFELLPKERAQYYADLNEQAFITGKIVHVTDWYDTDGTTTWHHLTLCPVLDEMGNVTKLIGFSRDITEEKNLLRELTKNKELAEAANQAKSAFLANMSHEIRTPMAAVLGFVDILEREDLSSEKKQNTLEAVRRNGTYLMNLLGEILDLTKIEAGQIDMHVTAVNLKEEITSVVELLRARAEKKQLALNVICSVNAASINTDPLRFRQILVNVISNAIKFTTKGSVDVSATVDGKLIRIDIRDTGMGIPERNQTEIFSPFSQGDADISGKFGGTGLGLAISSRLAAALGGKLQLTESAPGSGSVFSIWIDPSLAAPSNKDSRRKNLPPKSLKDLKVLTVEDNADVQDMLFDILSYEGAQVFRASNGKQALEKIGSENFNVVLMDVQMPEMNGYVATERLRQNGCLIPIIALTAFASVESTTRCMNAGFSGVLYKPFAKDELIEAILRHSKAPATNV